MKRLFALLFLLLPALAPAAEKTVALLPGRSVTYVAPDGWIGFSKENPPPGVQMIRQNSPDGRTSLQVLIVAIKPDSPFAAGTDTDAQLRKVHDIECSRYLQSGTERKDGPRWVRQARFQGLLSTFADPQYGDKPAPDGEFKYVTRATYLMGGLKDGVLLSVVILSNDLAGTGFASALAAANSFAFSPPPAAP